uniref:Uncharacterized protein n=1 Tax=Chenopodium quinoa TaxID=63459 RepID=A0A803N006_CHEQI
MRLKVPNPANQHQTDKFCETTPRDPPTLHQEEHINMDMENNNMNTDFESGFFSSNDDVGEQLGKRKRMNNLNARISKAIVANIVVHDPVQRRDEFNAENGRTETLQCDNQTSLSHSVVNEDPSQNGEATSKLKKRGDRGKYKSFVVDMKLKGQKSKLKVFIPDDIDRAIGENARHLVNECGRVVRTRAPLNVKNWKEAFAKAGDAMWREIQKVSERNSRNRLSKNRTTQTTGNLSFADVEDILEQLKVVVAAHGESKTQEEILLDVLKPRSGYFRGKGTALPGFSKGRHQLEHQSLIREQQKKIQEQQELIKELQENQERTTKQLEETQEATAKQLQQQKEETQRAMKEELLRALGNRVAS